MKKAKAKILVTGGAGYLGSILVPRLLKSGYSVVVLDSLLYGQTPLLDCCFNSRFHFVRGDAREASALRPLLKDADYLIPLAALVGAPKCDRDRVATVTTNTSAVKTLVKLASRNQRIIFPTTNSGYGIGQNGVLCTEESPIRPLSLYARTKLQAEEILLSRGNSISFRFATVFGMSPRMRLDLLVNDFTFRALTDRFIVVFEGNSRRNFLHIRDAASAFEHAMSRFSRMQGNAYNVGLDSANLSKLELCERIREQVPEFHFSEAPVGEDPDKRDYIVSNEKIRKAGFVPRVSLASGIRELIRGYQILAGQRFGNS